MNSSLSPDMKNAKKNVFRQTCTVISLKHKLQDTLSEWSFSLRIIKETVLKRKQRIEPKKMK